LVALVALAETAETVVMEMATATATVK